MFEWRTLNRMLVGFAVLAIGAASIGISIVKKQAFAESHRRSRQNILYYTLSRTDNPIIVLGDSIVEASTLPRELCGHAIVNAGLEGASTTSDLGGWLTDVLDGKPAAAIVIALGINDALGAARDLPQFEANYRLTRSGAFKGDAPCHHAGDPVAQMPRHVFPPRRERRPRRSSIATMPLCPHSPRAAARPLLRCRRCRHRTRSTEST